MHIDELNTIQLYFLAYYTEAIYNKIQIKQYHRAAFGHII